MADPTPSDALNSKLWIWGANDAKPRVLHTMIRVKDFAASLRFYVEGLGMKEFDRYEIAARRVSAIFVGFEGYAAGGIIELTRGWDAEGGYTHGTGYGHISIGVPDILAMVAKLEGMGFEITTRPDALISAGPRVAFVNDPDGYAVELIQTRKD